MWERAFGGLIGLCVVALVLHVTIWRLLLVMGIVAAVVILYCLISYAHTAVVFAVVWSVARLLEKTGVIRRWHRFKYRNYDFEAHMRQVRQQGRLDV